MAHPYALSVIIPNYNGVSLMKRFLPSVFNALSRARVNAEVIVVDDGSIDASRSFLEELGSKIIPVFHPTNQGFSAACNSGLERARGRVVFFLNNDVELKTDFFLTFEEHFQDDDVFAVTPLGFALPSREKLDGAKLMKWKRGNIRVTENCYSESPVPSNSVQGAYFFACTKRMRALGGFDELFAPFIFEETDLCYRARKRGWKIVFDPRMVAYHQKSATLTRVKRPFHLKVISERNRILFTLKNIHDSRLILSHLLYFLFKLVLLQPTSWCAGIQVCARWQRLMHARAKERASAVVTDRVLLEGTT